MMSDELVAFLDRHAPIATEDVVWGDAMRLCLTAYLSAEPPPPAYVSSVRAVVLRGPEVLVARDRDGLRHIVPGGRLEREETPEEALRREIVEETGWTLGRVEVLGFLHFQHLDPEPPDYRYAYPSFLQIIYAAEAIVHSRGSMAQDDHVVESVFMPVVAARALNLTPKELAYLDAAVRSL